VSQRLLDSPVVDGEFDEVIPEVEQASRLEDENRRLRAELTKADQRAQAAGAALAALRKQLAPLHRALRAVFGEIEVAIGPEETQSAATSPSSLSSPPRPSKAAAEWALWKQELPGRPADFISALEEHGELDTQQLVVVMHCPRKQTIYDTACKLTKLGLIQKNGDKYSLKSL
jgi:hypothetical protein